MPSAASYGTSLPGMASSGTTTKALPPVQPTVGSSGGGGSGSFGPVAPKPMGPAKPANLVVSTAKPAQQQINTVGQGIQQHTTAVNQRRKPCHRA
jgi:hypothetical protein